VAKENKVVLRGTNQGGVRMFGDKQMLVEGGSGWTGSDCLRNRKRKMGEKEEKLCCLNVEYLCSADGRG
jgi:hypothetical protein